LLALDHESRLNVSGVLPQVPAIGIVGARGATRLALTRATRLAGELASQGFAVVSGGARGVDAAAHRGALAAGGATVAVLGTGLDQTYPEEHAGLFADIVRCGGALASPFPAGTPVARWRFVARNQVIAALSQALVVVEAGVLSGSLTTARAAAKLGRPVLAVAGSPGCDRLLETGGATLCDGAADVVAALAGQLRRPQAARPAGDAGTMWNVLGCEAALAGDVAAGRAGLGPAAALAALAELELDGLALRDASGRWLRSRIEVA
jgi:DNA processing protein